MPESELATDLPEKLRRWLHLWGNRRDEYGQAFPWHDRIFAPAPEHYLPNGLIVVGNLEGGDCPAVAVSPLFDGGLVDWEGGKRYEHDDRWGIHYNSASEMLVKMTMSSLLARGRGFKDGDRTGAKLLLTTTPACGPEQYTLYHKDERLYLDSDLHPRAMYTTRPEPGEPEARFAISSALDREALRQLLTERGVDPAMYNLEGLHKSGSHVLAHRSGGWVTFYVKRDKEVDLRQFKYEEDACDHLYNVILIDHSDRS